MTKIESGAADITENASADTVNRQNIAIIEGLASEYTSVYYIDLETEAITPYVMNSATQNVFGETFKKGIKYSDAYAIYIDKFVSDSDKKIMTKAGSIPHLKKELTGRKSIKTTFQNSLGHYCVMKFVKINGENEKPTAVILGFADNDAEIRQELELRKNQTLVQTLSREYASVYYADLTTGELTVCSLSQEVKDKIGSFITEKLDFTTALNLTILSRIPESDREHIKKFGNPAYLKKLLRNQNTYWEIYRDGTEDNFEYYEMKIVKVNEGPEATAVVVGIANKDAEVRASFEAEKERRHNNEIIEILASEYSSVYYIDLETVALTPYAMNAETESEFGQIFNSGITYPEAYDMYVKKLVHAEDRSKMLNAGSVENIRKQLINQKTFLTTYRSSENRYCEMKFVKVGNETGVPKAVALGFADKDDELRAKIEAEKAQRRNNEIIEILASEYSSVYYIDLETVALTPYAMNAETESEFGQIFNSGITYPEAYDMYVKKLVHAEDRSNMLNAGSVENIRQLLTSQKTFTTTYRSSENRYCEMKFVKVGNENGVPKAVALGFADKDDLIRRNQDEELIHKRYYAVIKALSSEYASIYYADIQKNTLIPFNNSERISGKFGNDAFAGMSMSAAVDAYVNNACAPSDRNILRNALSVEYIREQLSTRQYYTTTYLNDKEQYCEMKCVRGDENEEINTIVVGFAVKDEEIRSRILQEQERQRNFDIIEILASEYSSVYYINLETDELTPYSMNADTESAFGTIFRSGIRYSQAFRMYVNTLIYPEDKTMMLKAGSLGNIMKELRNKKTFITTYRSENKDEPHYCEMKFVKVGNESGVPKAVALGFADKDDELRAKFEETKILQRNIDIIEILASEYTSVYYIDLTTDELDPYTMNADIESVFGTIFRSGIKYSDAFKMYVESLVFEEDKAMMLKAGSMYNILNELVNKKSFITTYRSDNNGNPHYCEMKFVKVGDDENPRAVALGFADKDEEIREELERKRIAERDMAVISSLSDDFGCVVYVDFNTYEEVHYRLDSLFEEQIPGWSEITNFDARLNMLITTLVHPDDREEFFAATRPNVVLDALSRNTGPYYVNFRILVGKRITYYQAKFVRDESTDDHIIAGFHNVDEETKRELAALDQAEAANKAKSSFLFNMSHDIRTPMNAIIGFTNMAKKYANDPERLNDCLNKVELSSQHLLYLINDVLDMARIESGKTELALEHINMEVMNANCESIISGQLLERRVEFITETDCSRHPFVIGDELRLRQILINILGNAVKFTPDNGKIWFRCREVKSDKKTVVYEFQVEDTGCGMTSEFLDHIWEAFSQEEKSARSEYKGTGLGMAITKQLVDLMNGSINVESEHGKGSKFTVTIPFVIDTDIPEEMMVHQKTRVVDFSGKKFLLVEDNELNREIAEEILEDEGIVVTCANDGQEAVDAFVSSDIGYFDAILMDIMMPVMNGYDAARTIRGLPRDDAKTIPIVALSANAFEEDKMKSYEAGMNAHVAKPIHVHKLMDILAKYV